MKKLIILIFIFLFAARISAQKYDRNWVMGLHYVESNPYDYINPVQFIFNDNILEIKPFCNTLDMIGTTISISNKEGNLLFYTNGNHIESSNCKRMENGDGLNEGSPFADNTPENYDFYFINYSQVILPDPLDSNIFYFLQSFGTLDLNGFAVAPKMQINKIDVSYNKGSGKVIYKNKTLTNKYSATVLNATKHANGIDWWVMYRSTDSNSYRELLLHRDSIIQENDFTLDPLQLYNFDDSFTCTWTPILFSPDGQTMVDIHGQQTVRIFNFNRCTGELSLKDTINFHVDSIELGTSYARWSGASGLSISSNSRFLYVINFNGIMQFDLLSDDIGNSRTKISGLYHLYDENQKIIPHEYFNSPYGQLGPDGKIYIFNQYNLQVINNPNEKGISCNFCGEINCLGINKYLVTTPYYPNYRLGALKGSPCDTGLSSKNIKDKQKFDLKFFPNPAIGDVLVEIDLPNFDASQLPELEIYDMLGRRVYEFEIPPFAYIHKIEAGNLLPGNYFSTLKVGGKVVATKGLIIAK